ncbi:STAS domain-containing protein [candidate division WOR-3 bacterium]|nr:STAS domain-containing protein [candidate division WOR-3 bacterium]
MAEAKKGKDKEVGVKNMEKRIETIEEVLAAAAGGDFSAEIPIAMEDADVLTSVETGINLLISDLGDEVRQSQARADELQEKLDLIEKQREAIEELSTPIIKIWDQVLVLPLIGALDTRRSQKLTENLLTEISGTQSKVAIMDITGVPTVDSAVANHILKTVASVKLLGAECIITGIRPDVAQTIVHLGVDLTDVETLSNLSEGLKWAFNNLRLSFGEGEKGK